MGLPAEVAQQLVAPTGTAQIALSLCWPVPPVSSSRTVSLPVHERTEGSPLGLFRLLSSRSGTVHAFRFCRCPPCREDHSVAPGSGRSTPCATPDGVAHGRAIRGSRFYRWRPGLGSRALARRPIRSPGSAQVVTLCSHRGVRAGEVMAAGSRTRSAYPQQTWLFRLRTPSGTITVRTAGD